ncbi:hypothetical protein [Glycomyces arizonensis]|uniref:hypothetical protein n=1 Tax=Glycomyces arizonensis TaxID=256035 RepID=UPI0003F99FD3|nr:hypothetical protein [Glycomyces arizonensis]
MTLLRLIPAAALFAVAACGAGERAPDEPEGGSGQGEADETVYQGALTVLENEEHGPQLAGVVAQSYPPQGGGLDVAGWDWEAVEHDEAAGTRWGMYLVTGTFNGEAFELTEEPVPADEVDMDDYPHLQPGEPETPEPAEPLPEAELQGIVDDLTERFPALVNGGWADAENGVARIDATLVTPELESYAAETYPEGTVVFSSMLEPVP